MGGRILAHGEKTFESYLQDTQYNAIFVALKSYIYKNRRRLNLSTRIVPDPDYPELDDILVLGVTFKEGEGDCIRFRAAVQTDVIHSILLEWPLSYLQYPFFCQYHSALCEI